MIAWIKKNLGHAASATLAILMLAAIVPQVFALSFSGNTWGLTGGSAVVIHSQTADSFLLRFIDGDPVTGIYTITSSVNGISAGTGDNLGGDVVGFTGNPLIAGSFTISVTTTHYDENIEPTQDGVMFSSEFSFDLEIQPSNAEFITQVLDGPEPPFNPTVTITINFTGAQFATQGSTPWTLFSFYEL